MVYFYNPDHIFHQINGKFKPTLVDKGPRRSHLHLVVCLLHFKQRSLAEWSLLDRVKREWFYSIRLTVRRVFIAIIRALWQGCGLILCEAEYIKNDPFKSDTWWFYMSGCQLERAALVTTAEAWLNQRWAEMHAIRALNWLIPLCKYTHNQQFVFSQPTET